VENARSGIFSIEIFFSNIQNTVTFRILKFLVDILKIKSAQLYYDVKYTINI